MYECTRLRRQSRGVRNGSLTPDVCGPLVVERRGRHDAQEQRQHPLRRSPRRFEAPAPGRGSWGRPCGGRGVRAGVGSVAHCVRPSERAPSLTCPPVPGYPCRLSRDSRSWLLSVAFTTTRPCSTVPQVRGGFLWVRGCMEALASTPSVVWPVLGMHSWAGTIICY